jgi:hypothetical protein
MQSGGWEWQGKVEKKFVLLKLFLGKYWETIKELKSKGESSKRLVLKKEFNFIQ